MKLLDEVRITFIVHNTTPHQRVSAHFKDGERLLANKHVVGTGSRTIRAEK